MKEQTNSNEITEQSNLAESSWTFSDAENCLQRIVVVVVLNFLYFYTRDTSQLEMGRAHRGKIIIFDERQLHVSRTFQLDVVVSAPIEADDASLYELP